MPSNVKTYDGTGDPEDHLKYFQAAAKIERWAMPTWCHMFNSTLIGSARTLSKGEVAAANQSRKKAQPTWRHHETNHKPSFDKRPDFKSQYKVGRRQDRFTPLTKTPKEILAMVTVKFKAPPPMTGPVENQNKNKFCKFHGDKGHNMDECIHLRRHIEEAVRSGQLSHLVKEIKQGGKQGEHAKDTKKGETPNKEKATTIFIGRQENPIVIEAEVEGHLIHRMYVDRGSASEVLYEHCFNKLRPEINQMIPATTPLIGFSGKISWPLGQISLMVSLGDGEHSTSTSMNFMVVRSPSPYNGIIDRPSLRKIQAVPSTAHGMLKFLVEGGIVTIRSSTIILTECRMVAGAPNGPPPQEPTATEGIKVAIHPEYPEQTVTIGGSLSEKGRMELCNLLKENLDIFAWKPADMTGVPRSIAEHRLNIHEGCQPIRQKRRGQASDTNKAIQAEVAKLVEAEIIREVYYYDWLSNPVMVKSTMAAGGYAYKGYHQIQMAKEDEEKTTYETNQGVFCYTKMPFGLKNAGATYQRLVDKAFEKQIGRNLKVHVDDLVIKSHTEHEILRDIKETFHNLRRINMKLNPKKCTFGAEEGVFLGHVVSMKGIKACPEKAEAVVKLQSPQTLKEVQSLNGKLASLNRFLSKSAEKSLPFFKTLKRCMKKSDFQWKPKAEMAFQGMKQCIAELPMVTTPRPKEELIMYLCAAKEAVSAVLLAERDSQQIPVYFVSRAL
ncbi:reverse transcriptase domain-containing protein [Tanacetum coccineum]